MSASTPFEETYFHRDFAQKVLSDPYNLNSWTGTKYQWIMEITGRPEPGSRCLELGCGLGQGAWLLAHTAGSVVGVDVSSFAIEFARKHYGEKAGIEFLCADILDLTLPGPFDRIYCVHVLEHLQRENGWRLAQNLLNFCHADTKVYLNLPLEGSMVSRYNRWMDRRAQIPPHDPTHISFFSVSELLKMFSQKGFKVVEKTYILFPSKKLRFLFDRAVVPDLIKNPFTVEGLFVFQIK